MDFIWLLVIVSALLVYFNAGNIGAKKGQLTSLANLGPGGWFLAARLFWIIACPLYMAKRGEFKRVKCWP